MTIDLPVLSVDFTCMGLRRCKQANAVPQFIHISEKRKELGDWPETSQWSVHFRDQPSGTSSEQTRLQEAENGNHICIYYSYSQSILSSICSTCQQMDVLNKALTHANHTHIPVLLIQSW